MKKIFLCPVDENKIYEIPALCDNCKNYYSCLSFIDFDFKACEKHDFKEGKCQTLEPNTGCTYFKYGCKGCAFTKEDIAFNNKLQGLSKNEKYQMIIDKVNSKKRKVIK